MTGEHEAQQRGKCDGDEGVEEWSSANGVTGVSLHGLRRGTRAGKDEKGNIRRPRLHVSKNELLAPSVMFDSPALLSTFFFSTTNALHLYLDASQKRRFIEEVPSNSVFEGGHQRRIYLTQYILSLFHTAVFRPLPCTRMKRKRSGLQGQRRAGHSGAGQSE